MKADHWKLRIAGWLLPFLLVSSFFTACQRPKGGMTVAGSTSVEPFAGLLAEEYMRLHPEVHIYVQGGGSTAGVEAARSHAANIGMSSRSLLPNEKDLSAVTIARDAIAVIVHPSNPIRNLSLIQVREVFSGKIKRWKELGGPDHPICPGYSRGRIRHTGSLSEIRHGKRGDQPCRPRAGLERRHSSGCVQRPQHHRIHLPRACER